MATSVDPATIGQYGTVRLLSNKTNHPIASYPIDQPTTTFGRDEACDIRMYFLWVSSLHCKLIFEDYKAFLTVSSPNGVIVDGCGVFPSEATGEATTVPLTNRSVLAIHNKRFIFEYPPKELRVKAFMTPRPKSRKSLRLSMINAAHILTPARGTPRHLSAALDLDVLRSPVKPYAQSPLKEMREEEVRVVDGENVVVVEQEQDLVLLEELDEDTSKSYPEPQTPTPSTPIRPRSNSKARMSLHKAVLVRNSRRALQRQEQDPGAPSNRPQQAGEPPATSYDQHEQHEQNASGHQDAGQQDYAVYSDEEEEEEQEEPQPVIHLTEILVNRQISLNLASCYRNLPLPPAVSASAKAWKRLPAYLGA
ncbi:hypothetical protein BOTBODRAFT_256201 [Botryobasidium botryosum FD-172 SS1]|uniref:FHA domain-containing protein n=1 Tax=Botryobasidium botryosum (strain FD-172 SS1) TaxID=930990 RepID=A0A067LT89_BOTB1|nr:hypothetical protein BOTBODRAFT_256201 [Botryobasidium botryosum FD-172 SS1]